MKAKFYADTRSKGEFTNIIIRISHDSKQFNRSTGVSLPRQFWDFKNNWIKGVNAYALQTRDKLLDIKDYVETSELGSLEEMKVSFDRKYKGVKVLPKAKISGLQDYIQTFIDLHKSKYSADTIRKYKTTKRNILMYCNARNISDSINDMSIDEQRIFFGDFVNFLCYEEGFIDKVLMKSPYQNSTVFGELKNIKSVCNFFDELNLKININKAVNKSSFRAAEQKAIYCTPEEIVKIYNRECEGIAEEVRDCSIFQAYTGLRHNELYSVTKNNITTMMEGGKSFPVLSHIQNKSKKRNNIPLNDICESILHKWSKRKFDTPKKYDKPNKEWIYFEDCILPVRCNQKSNVHLHRICRALKMFDEVTEVKYSGKNKIVKTSLKWQLVTTHTMRHSFAYYMKEHGMPDGQVAELMGIDEATYRKNYRHSFGQKVILKAYEALNAKVLDNSIAL